MPMKFNLKYSEVFQGSFAVGKLNLLMAFQVNCPGCFIHGFPLMETLRLKFADKISFFALSTAFEDFDLNTLENTRSFVEKGILVGETKKAFDEHHLNWRGQAIPFPVLFDSVIEKEEMLRPGFIENIIANHPHFQDGTAKDLEEAKHSLQDYFGNYQKCGFTFAANLMQGTPTFVLFDSELEIQLQWFGHQDPERVEEKLKLYL
jgi:hypothetical protein